MARGRMISKSLSTSQRRAALYTACPKLAEFCQMLYVLLVVHADDFGRLAGDEFTVKHQVDPTSPRKLADFSTALSALHEVGLIQWYAVSAVKVIQIVKFEEHQSGLHRRTKSRLPEPECESTASPDNSGNFPEVPDDSGNFPLKRREGNRTEENRTE